MKRVVLCVLAGVLLWLPCGQARAVSANEDAALGAARVWLALVDAGRYADSWKKASAYFQGAVNRETWVASLDGIRKPLGKVRSRKVAKVKETTELPGAPDGRYVVLSFSASFEKKKTATETVTFMSEDGAWKAAGYFIK
ncbi:MAG TPA: DUF4019 domain-containing protein [Geobacteraceae bacterium]